MTKGFCFVLKMIIHSQIVTCFFFFLFSPVSKFSTLGQWGALPVAFGQLSHSGADGTLEGQM